LKPSRRSSRRARRTARTARDGMMSGGGRTKERRHRVAARATLRHHVVRQRGPSRVRKASAQHARKAQIRRGATRGSGRRKSRRTCKQDEKGKTPTGSAQTQHQAPAENGMREGAFMRANQLPTPAGSGCACGQAAEGGGKKESNGDLYPWVPILLLDHLCVAFSVLSLLLMAIVCVQVNELRAGANE